MSQKFLISIIDDDPSVCEGTLDLITAMGFVGATFRTADEFLRSGSRDATTCLILDVQMPGMNGLDLHDHLVGSGHDIPTILVTAFPKEADRIRALRAGIHCYLVKPFNERELLACVGSAIASAAARTMRAGHDDHY